MLNVARTDVEGLVFGHHIKRVRSSGAGAWKVAGRSIAVIYGHPDHDDATAARILTLCAGAFDPRHIQSIAARGACFKPRGVLHTRLPQATKGATRWAPRSMRR